MKFFLFALFLPIVAFGADIDTKLQGYIEKFNLKPLSRPETKNIPLAKLGELLFTTPLLSGNNNISCADCHHPTNMTMDGLPLGLGEGAKGIQTPTSHRNQNTGKILARNTPALFNLASVDTMFWDGRVRFDRSAGTFTTPVNEINGSAPVRKDIATTLKSALAAQALFPMANHDEMRGAAGTNPIADAQTDVEAWDLIVKEVMAEPRFRQLLTELYPGETINIGHLGEAIAEFERQAFFFANTPYDNYLKGDLTAMTEIQKSGMEIFFNKGKCGECHNGEHLSNFEFHSVGIPQVGPGKKDGDDYGRAEWDPTPENLYAFRVPPLRNVALTPPYMHDGIFKTLPQVVEHYDTTIQGLRGFKLVNNWKNYVEAITDADHTKDDVRVRVISTKMTTPLNFEPNEEKALAEFLATALTDKAFLGREIDGDYRTYFRMQLRESGFNKLSEKFQGENHEEVYYYFDLLAEKSFVLRALANPIRIILVKKPGETKLVYRQQAYKTATSESGIVMEGNFNRQEERVVDPGLFESIEKSYLDMFNRIYAYNDGVHSTELPLAELSIIKADVQSMNDGVHKLEFDGEDVVSDQVNIRKEELFFVPTSYNAKDVNLFTLTVQGKKVDVNLQRSVIRTETGGTETTYAIELETGRISKAEFPAFAKALVKSLGDLRPEDVGGSTPSPSNLTLKILNQVLE